MWRVQKFVQGASAGCRVHRVRRAQRFRERRAWDARWWGRSEGTEWNVSDTECPGEILEGGRGEIEGLHTMLARFEILMRCIGW